VAAQEQEGGGDAGEAGEAGGEETEFEYDEDLHEQLLNMGFEEEDVMSALRVAPFDKSAALDYLYVCPFALHTRVLAIG
jgi:hypothetical protein